MAHFVELDENNVVIEILVVENQDILDENGNESEEVGVSHLKYHHGQDRRWIQTSYNGNFRGRYAGIGYTYREDLDAFITPQPFASWILNENTTEWEAPVPMPQLTREQIYSETHRYGYRWDEENQTWDLVATEFPKPFPSWIMNETLNMWEAPVPMPQLTREQMYNQSYRWNEENQTWDLVATEFPTT